MKVKVSGSKVANINAIITVVLFISASVLIGVYSHCAK